VCLSAFLRGVDLLPLLTNLSTVKIIESRKNTIGPQECPLKSDEGYLPGLLGHYETPSGGAYQSVCKAPVSGVHRNLEEILQSCPECNTGEEHGSGEYYSEEHGPCQVCPKGMV
jgi:hypothetical protein